MSRMSRMLNAVTPTRVVMFLLIVGLGQEIAPVLPWLASTAEALRGVPTLRACVSAALNLAIETIVIYLAIRSLAWLAGRRLRKAGPPPRGGLRGEASELSREEVRRGRDLDHS